MNLIMQKGENRTMRVSFDVDDTLVIHTAAALAERGWLPDFIHRWFCEPLRFGTCSLFRELRRQGCSIWIYTTSSRAPFSVRLWFLLHGVRVDGVINFERHVRDLTGHTFSRLPSKYPPAFGIDLHVDDSVGVRMEGEEHGFRVVVVSPDDPRWTEKILDAVAHETTCNGIFPPASS